MTVKEYPFKTIDNKEYPDMVDCEWFNEENHLKHSAFHIDELEIISE